jgi:hypothetical protein
MFFLFEGIYIIIEAFFDLMLCFYYVKHHLFQHLSQVFPAEFGRTTFFPDTPLMRPLLAQMESRTSRFSRSYSGSEEDSLRKVTWENFCKINVPANLLNTLFSSFPGRPAIGVL